MNNKTTDAWQRQVREELAEPAPLKLRMSSAGRCQRALTYTAFGHQPTDPPNQPAQNRMALGHMAEILIIQEMERNGWQTDHTVLSDGGQLEVNITLPQSGETISGHPDGICRHPRFTNNLWVTLECKSMSQDMAERVETEGVIAVYPHYLSQIALYGYELHRRKLVSHPERGVFGVMDRNGHFLPPERILWTAEDRERAIANLDSAAGNAETGELPNRPYERDSQECLFCHYHKLCWGSTPKAAPIIPNIGNNRIKTTARENEAARLWQKLNPQVREAREILQNAVDRAGGGVIDTGEVIAGYFVPKNAPMYDHEKLKRLVPADILQKCLRPQETPRKAFWVRESTKK